jgi:hypothetical protein
MAATARRRASGEDSIYFDAANNCWTAAISLGFSPDGKRLRPKVTGRTKTAVKDSCQAPGSDRPARPGGPGRACWVPLHAVAAVVRRSWQAAVAALAVLAGPGQQIGRWPCRRPHPTEMREPCSSFSGCQVSA